MKRHSSLEWWYSEEGLFNVDNEGRYEKQQCAVAVSNIIRNFSFMPDNETIMAQHRHCLESLFQCIESQNSGETGCILPSYIAYLYSCFSLKIRSLFFMRNLENNLEISLLL